MKLISSSGKGNFKLIDNSKEIYELNYVNWFSGKATTSFKNNTIEIKPKNIWTSRVDIYKNKNSIGDITFNLKGEMVIRLENRSAKECHYVLKNKALFKPKFEIFDGAETLQFTMNSVNNWSKLNYGYDIELANFNEKIAIEELLIYCGYAANLYLAIISAV